MYILYLVRTSICTGIFSIYILYNILNIHSSSSNYKCCSCMNIKFHFIAKLVFGDPASPSWAYFYQSYISLITYLFSFILDFFFKKFRSSTTISFPVFSANSASLFMIDNKSFLVLFPLPNLYIILSILTK